MAYRRQTGQALVFGLFVLVSGLAALLFFFNVGQITREKTKLINAADAVAYSAGVIHARALNFNAYSNRALMANEVMIAQMVSISSWAGYVESWAGSLQLIHPECVAAANGSSIGLTGLRNFGPDYFIGCIPLQWARQSDLVRPAVRSTQQLIQPAIEIAEFQKSVILSAQRALNLLGGTVAERSVVMNAVALANYQGDGRVSVDLISPSLPDDWTRMASGSGGGVTPFVRRYADNERTRFREATLSARDTDPYLRGRVWQSRALIPEPSCLGVGRWRLNEVRRRGGTELLGFEEWQAVDTQSLHQNFRRRLSCRQREIPTAMVLMAGMDLPLQAIREQITSAVDVIVQQTRFGCGSRLVTSVAEVTGMESGKIQLQEIFRFQSQGYIGENGKVQGLFTACDMVPTFYEELRATGQQLDMGIFKPAQGFRERHE